MNTDYLREFVALAENGNYSQTAENLFISQSSLSKHIMALEKDLRVTLLDRTTRNVRLSPDGEMFLPYAVKISNLLNDYTIASKKNKETEGDRFSIASTSQMPLYNTIMDPLKEYKRWNPGISIDIIIEPHSGLKRLLTHHKADFIWIGEREGDQKESEFIRLPFQQESLVAVVSKKHPLAGNGAIQIERLQTQDLIISDNSTIEHHLLLEFCKTHGFTPKITTLPSNILIDFAKQELGTAITFNSVAQKLSDAETVLVNIESSPIVHVNLLYLKGRKLSLAAKSFLKFLDGWL